MLQITQDIVNDNGTLNLALLDAVLEYHEGEKTTLQNLKDYYDGDHAILDAELDETKPDNRLVNNYPEYIVTVIQGYFMGKPVTYKFQDENLEKKISEIFRYNDEQDENSELAKLMGIFGNAYEVLYTDEDANVRFNEISPLECIIAYNTKINPEPLFAVRYYTVTDLLEDEDITNVEVYTKDRIFTLTKSGSEYALIEEREHFFEMVPVIEYINNDERKSDFSSVISLVDAYNRTTSNKQNDLDYFSDAYLCLVGMDGTTQEDASDMKKNRIILMKEQGQAQFLIKNSNDAESEHQKDRLNADIHKFANVPDLSDEQFAGNSSGVAMAYKLFGTEQKAVEKERKFTTALMKRLEMICTLLNKKNTTKFDYTGVEISYTRNVPVDEKQAVEIATLLKGIVSTETAISYLPMVHDLQAEMKRIEDEKKDYVDLDAVQDDTTTENPKDEDETIKTNEE